MSRIASLLQDAELSLKAAGVDTPRLDARLLLAHVMDWQPQMVGLRGDMLLSADQIASFQAVLTRRLQRQPVSQIIGKRGFWTLDLTVTADTLDPRPDSETLIQAVLDGVSDRTQSLNILDFGTGTGCLLLSLLSEYPNAQGVGVDISPAALAVAAGNAGLCGLADRAAFVQSRWGDALDGAAFDIIISNPPYIPDADIEMLEPEVKQWEPRLALSGGADGLDCYRTLLPHAFRLLKAGGMVVVEIGIGQAADVAAIGAACGLYPQRVCQDLGGIERCIVFRG